jgi:cytochrome P450
MFSLIVWALLLLPAIYFLNTGWSLVRNVRTAEASGIPYIVVPYYSYNRFVSILGRPLFRFLDAQFPKPSVTSWRHLVKMNWPWNLRHAPFAKMGTDSFLTVAPGGIILYTADANVIAQITTRWTDFPKPTHLYKSVNIYGTNIVSSEGAAWRHHRKLTSPSFGEKNNQLVWKETLDQSQAMLESWVGPYGSGKTIDRIGGDTMQLSINVISRAGLSQKLEWAKAAEDSEVTGNRSLPNGHTMSFTHSLHCLLSHLLLVMLLPKWFLSMLSLSKVLLACILIVCLGNYPSAMLRESCEAYDEWGKYMKEIVAAKKNAIRSGRESPTVDIIGQLVKGQQEGTQGKSQGPEALTDSEVMGNLFVFMLAGHETSANSIHFSLLLLAIHPEIQKKVQKELDEIFQGRPVSEWDYDRDLHRLLGGMLGAVLNEELRVIAPVITVPKTVCSKPQQLSVNGKEVTIPANIMVRLCVPSVHRNPKFWPHGPPRNLQKPYFPPSNLDNDLEEFKPERWLKNYKNDAAWNHANISGKEAKASDTNDPSRSTSHSTCPDTASSGLYNPLKGAYIPFSEGHRACLGRRFAQVEILAALATILSQYSVELAVDEWASDDEVECLLRDEGTMGEKMAKAAKREERRRIWEKARDKADFIWQNKMVSVITLQLRGASVPLRVVRRGEERFWDL